VVRQLWLAIAILLCAAPVFAGEQKTVPPQPKVDPALLEFIGAWQASDGEWVDPMTFARIDPGKLTEEKARREGKTIPPAKQPPPNLAGALEQSL
jgi:hypothetical protein